MDDELCCPAIDFAPKTFPPSCLLCPWVFCSRWMCRCCGWGNTVFLVHGLSQNKGLGAPGPLATCCNPDLPRVFQLASPLVQILLSVQAALLLWASFVLLHPELRRPLLGLHVRVWSGLQIDHPCTCDIFSEFSYPDSLTFPLSVDFVFLLPLTVGITSWALPLTLSSPSSGHSPSFPHPTFPSGRHTQILPTHSALLNSRESAYLPNTSMGELQNYLRLIIS